MRRVRPSGKEIPGAQARQGAREATPPASVMSHKVKKKQKMESPTVKQRIEPQHGSKKPQRKRFRGGWNTACFYTSLIKATRLAICVWMGW